MLGLAVAAAPANGHTGIPPVTSPILSCTYEFFGAIQTSRVRTTAPTPGHGTGANAQGFSPMARDVVERELCDARRAGGRGQPALLPFAAPQAALRRVLGVRTMNNPSRESEAR